MSTSLSPLITEDAARNFTSKAHYKLQLQMVYIQNISKVKYLQMSD